MLSLVAWETSVVLPQLDVPSFVDLSWEASPFLKTRWAVR